MQPRERRPQAAKILPFRKFKRICRLHLNRVPFGFTLIDGERGAGDGSGAGRGGSPTSQSTRSAIGADEAVDVPGLLEQQPGATV